MIKKLIKDQQEVSIYYTHGSKGDNLHCNVVAFDENLRLLKLIPLDQHNKCDVILPLASINRINIIRHD
ncbi:MAG: hypothetical protein FH758_03855 [Firmicutes bacterium]|nr:hypothetical protein [Bacillota bacterium]